ncbi:hypothetical protein [Streptomyces sp. enrichment culture]|uniref:hypothetical protein n=1 Tax=Streptomyces sp. enrichment culture TaxID=1795815 RepID=UPI003F556432
MGDGAAHRQVCAVAAAVAAALTALGMIGLRTPGSGGDEESGTAPSAHGGAAPDPVPAR